MNIDLIVKIFFINVLTYFVFNKVKNRSIIKSEIVKTVLASALGTITYMLLNKYTEHIAANIILYFIQIILLKTLFFYEEENIITTNLLANAIVYIGFVIAMLIESIPMYLIKIHNNTINIIMILIIETILIIGFFNIKRFKKGFDFLINKYNKNSGFFRVNAAGQIIQRNLHNILPYFFRMFCIIRQCLCIGNHKI